MAASTEVPDAMSSHLKNIQRFVRNGRIPRVSNYYNLQEWLAQDDGGSTP